MIRRSLSTLCAGLVLMSLAGCGQRSDSFLEQIVSTGVGELLGPDEAPTEPPQPTREQLAELPGPLLAISFKDVVGTGFITAVNDTADGYITYQDRTRRSVIVRGGLITGLQGFRYDLSSVKTQRDDPVVYQTPVADWPKTIFRNYRFSLQSMDDFQVSVQCTLTKQPTERIVIYEIVQEVTPVREDCLNDRRRFTNMYWVAEETGFIWRSNQWVGPFLQPARLDVIRPHPEGRVTN